MRAVLLLGFAVLPGVAAADTQTVPGQSLVLSVTSDADTRIVPDPALSGQVRVEQAGKSCVSAAGGATATITTDGCGGGSGRVTIAVPPGFPVTLTENSSGNVLIGDIDGQLIATLNGDGDLRAGRTAELVVTVGGSGDAAFGAVAGSARIESSGSGDVRIRSIAGTLQSRQSGSGDLAIGEVHAAEATIAIDGNGDALIGTGNIDKLAANLTSDGSLNVQATVGNADLRASGGGDIRLGRVTGTVQKDSSGGSDIVIGGSALANVAMDKVASALANADFSSDEHDGNRVIYMHPGEGSDIWHWLTIGFVALILLAIYRTVQRNGGWARIRQMRGTVPSTGAPSHPGVLALRDAMARLEGRLGQVEAYITSREFDLQRKFRDLGPS